MMNPITTKPTTGKVMPSKTDKSDDEWRELLDDDAYQVTRCGGTERAFTGKFWDHKAKGSYACICCGAQLFTSETKYDSGSGWPSFFKPADSNRILEKEDVSHNMRRVEVLCADCGAHLGHLFPDGPQPTGQRYCINSASLDFKESDG